MVSVSVRRNPGEPVGRNARASYPHPENPGLIEQVDGFYDWADRRLFLADGSPDPATPGAYRYQTRPDLCDLAAPASDPASPHYEPPHLRHRPGDTWKIGGKPRDPDAPGPFDSPGWRPDPRTGRHRRGELPDPIPPWEQMPTTERAQERESNPGRAQEHAPPIAPDQPQVRPRRRPWFWQEEVQAGRAVQQEEEPYRFEKLREDAWDRFVIKSSELAAAHWADRRALECPHRWLIVVLLRLFRWMFGVVKWPLASEEFVPTAVPRQPDRRSPSQAGGQAAPRPGAQLAQAIRGTQAGRAARTGTAREAAQPNQGVEAAQASQAARDAAHQSSRPREEHRRPSPLPYIARWERAFDANRAFGEVAVL